MRKSFLYIIFVCSIFSCSIEGEGLPSDREQMGVVGQKPVASKATLPLWSEGDEIGVVPMDGVSMQAMYSVSSIGQGNSAIFDGGAWNVRTGKGYAAYYPFRNEPYFASDSVVMYLSGQKQSRNATYEHVKDFDLMYAKAVAPSNGQCLFEFERKLCILTLNLFSSEGGIFNSVELLSESGFPTVCSMPLAGGETEPGYFSGRICLSLNDIEVCKGGCLKVAIVLFPWDYSSETIVVKAVRTDGVCYYAAIYDCSLLPGEVEFDAEISSFNNEKFRMGDQYNQTNFTIL